MRTRGREKRTPAGRLHQPDGPVLTDLEVLRRVSTEVCAAALPTIPSVRMFQKHVQAGIFPPPVARGVHDFIAVLQAFADMVQAEAAGDDSIAEAKRRFWNARAQREEQEAATEADQLLVKADVLEVERQAMIVLATQMDAVASRLASEVAGLSDAAVIRRRLLDELRACRASAARIFEARGAATRDVAGDGDDAPATAAADAG